MAAPAHPPQAWMRAAWAVLRRPSWPLTFDAAMADPLYRALMHGAAVRMQRGTWGPVIVPSTTATRQRIQRTTAAANDLFESPMTPTCPTQPDTACPAPSPAAAERAEPPSFAVLRMLQLYITSDIETSCPAVRLPESTAVWYDTRPMLDEREHAPEVIDMAREALSYGLATQLLQRHPDQPHLVRVHRQL